MRQNLAISFILATLSSCSSYEFDYVVDQKDSSNVLTRIRHEGHTYFVYGKYDQENIPQDQYLKIGTQKTISDYELFLYWKRDTAYLESLQGGVYTAVNLPAKFVFKDYETNEIDRFSALRHDTTGYYTYLCDCDLPAPKPDPLPENHGKPILDQNFKHR